MNKDLYFNYETAKLFKKYSYRQTLNDPDDESEAMSTMVYLSDEPNNLIDYYGADLYGCLDDDYQERHNIECFFVPSIYEAAEWLRNEKKIFIDVRLLNGNGESYFYMIWKIDDAEEPLFVETNNNSYDYENVLKNGIVYTLKNLLN